jgi:hypothetical protein
MPDNEDHLNDDPVIIEPATRNRRNRRQRIARVQIPPEIHALAELTGLDPDLLIAGLVARGVAAIRARASGIVGGAL